MHPLNLSMPKTSHRSYTKENIIQFPVYKGNFKNVRTCEIKQRGFQRKNQIRYGTKAEENIIFGDYILVPGTVCNKSEFVNESMGFTYFINNYVLNGNVVFRKGCRPNTCLELRTKNKEVVLVAKAIRDISVNEEIVLPIDYENSDECVKCVCNDLKFCLK